MVLIMVKVIGTLLKQKHLQLNFIIHWKELSGINNGKSYRDTFKPEIICNSNLFCRDLKENFKKANFCTPFLVAL